jgi:hypothetical protein
MNTQDLIAAITAPFIVGMIWLRTRMQYTQRGRGVLQLEPAGRIYFASAVALLVLGWFGAPALGRAVWPASGASPTLMRVVWFLATYYAFIIVHRVLKARGVVVFRLRGDPLS